MVSHLRRLGFIVGGVQKAGTTSLFGYLKDHPALLAPTRKELHHFDNEALDWSSPPTSALDGFFPEPAAGRIAFDVTPIYLFWPPSLERIKAYDPHMKLIFIFRDPIERAWSHWRMETARHLETLPFSVAIRQGRWRLRDAPPLDPAWRVYSYVERGFYGSQLARLFALFAPENVLLLRADDLKTQHERVLSQIADFLELPPFPSLAPRLDHRGENSKSPVPMEDADHLREVFRDEVIEFSRLSGLPVADWLTRKGATA